MKKTSFFVVIYRFFKQCKRKKSGQKILKRKCKRNSFHSSFDALVTKVISLPWSEKQLNLVEIRQISHFFTIFTIARFVRIARNPRIAKMQELRKIKELRKN